MKKRANPIITGTLILTVTGLLARLIGFFYRIYLSNLIGAEGMGIYQLIAPISGICFALCCGPIQTAVSRFVAASIGMNQTRAARSNYYAGLLLTEMLAIATALVLYTQAGWIALHLLSEPRCIVLLQLLALSLPITAAHAAMNGYYYGLRRTEVPSLSQLAEQFIRVLMVYLIAGKLNETGQEITVTIAALGLIAGELGSLAVSYIAISITFRKEDKLLDQALKPALGTPIRKILLLATPLAANRLILGVLQSIEAIQIPSRLQVSGLTSSAALSVYGVLTGMSLPFILFPSALTNSVAVMLLPSVAEAQSVKDDKKIERTTELSMGYSLYLGILCTGIFITYGGDMGSLFFHDASAGAYIRILGWLCPFLYVTTTAGSIINGMGRTSTTFIQNVLGLVLRLGFVIFLIPRFGIVAYLWGALACQLLVSGLHTYSLWKMVPFSFSAFHRIFRPMSAVAIAVWVTQTFVQISGIAGLVLGCIGICLIYFLLLYVTGTTPLPFRKNKER